MRNTAVFLVLFATWMLWSGHTDVLLVSFGLVSCALVVWLGHRLQVLDREGFPLELFSQLLGYIPWVLWQVVKSNLDVARIILSPSLPVRSHLVQIDVKQRTPLGQAIHANTITLTPGTFTLDVRDNTFLIHTLTPELVCPDGTTELDDRVARLERPRRGRSGPAESSKTTSDETTV